MQARNNRELAHMLAPAVMNGLKIMAEEYLEPDIRSNIHNRVDRGVKGGYRANADGSLSQAWNTDVEVSISPYVLGVLTTYYDSDKLIYDDEYQYYMCESEYGYHIAGVYGKHTSPYNYSRGEDIEDMASLIDLGLGGPLYGRHNPTRRATHFWDSGVIPSFESHNRSWIKSGLRQAGLKVI